MKNLSFGGIRLRSKLLACFFLLSAHNLGFAISVSKGFFPTLITTDQTSLLTILVSNTNAQPTDAGSLNIMDTLPVGLVVAPGTVIVGPNCGGLTNLPSPGDTVINLTGGTIPNGLTCIVQIPVGSNVMDTYPNTIEIGQANYSIGGVLQPGNSASATLTVGPLLFTKTFTPSTIPSGGTSVLTLTLSTINGAPTAENSLQIGDQLAGANIIIADPANATQMGCGDGTLTATPGTTLISLMGGEILANGTCVISVNVTSTTLGTRSNIANAIYNSEGLIRTSITNADLLVVSAAVAPVVTKSFAQSTINPGQSSLLTITVQNPNAQATDANSLTILDNLPTGVTIVNPPAATQVGCGDGTLTADNLGTQIKLENGEIGPNGICIIEVQVRLGTPGTVTNTATATFSLGEISLTGSGSADLTLSSSRPTIEKRFIPNDVQDCGCSTLLITLTNPSSSPALLTADLIDRLPKGLETVGRAKTTCGSWVDVSRSKVILKAGAFIPAHSHCTISVDVDALCNGVFTNIIPAGALQTNIGSNLERAVARVEFGCEDVAQAREVCAAESTIDEEKEISLYIK